MKISAVLFFLNRPSQSHHLAYSSVPVRQTPFSGISLCGCYTSASISEDVKMMGRLSHCLDICAFICLRVRSELQKNAPPKVQNSQSRSGQLLVVVSERSKAEEGCMKRYRVAERHTSPTVAPGEHEGFGLRFKVKGKQHRDM